MRRTAPPPPPERGTPGPAPIGTFGPGRGRVQLLLAGIDGHRSALPHRVEAALAEFATVATIDDMAVDCPRIEEADRLVTPVAV